MLYIKLPVHCIGILLLFELNLSLLTNVKTETAEEKNTTHYCSFDVFPLYENLIICDQQFPILLEFLKFSNMHYQLRIVYKSNGSREDL